MAFYELIDFRRCRASPKMTSPERTRRRVGMAVSATAAAVILSRCVAATTSVRRSQARTQTPDAELPSFALGRRLRFGHGDDAGAMGRNRPTW